MTTPARQPDSPTTRLAPQSEDATVRLERDATAQRPAPENRFHDTDSATWLDPQAWPTTPFPAPREELHRYGPGVPSPAADAWRGTVTTPPRSRRRRGWLVPLALLIAVLGYLAWPRFGAPFAVSAVTLRVDPARLSCDSTMVVAGTVQTNGGGGTVTYHWIRSDGTDSGVLTQRVPAGQPRTEVTLRWTFQGHGTVHAKATLAVLAPSPRSASVTFPYHCP
jgi:hypothetical protein